MADSAGSHGVISLTFDDAWQNQYSNAFPLLQARGMTGTFYVITNKLNTSPTGTTFLSFAELQSMQNYGCEIASHSVDHADFTTLTDSQIIQECQDSKTVLQSYGLTVNNFAYPFGAYNAHTDSIVPRYYRSARDVYCPGNVSQLQYSQWHVPADNGAPGDPGCLSSLESIVDQAYSSNKWAVIYFHQILPNVVNSPSVINTQTFASFLDYIKSKGVPNLTVNQALNLAATSTPAPTSSPTSTTTPTPTPMPMSSSTGSVFFSGFEDGFNSWTSTSGGVSVVSSPVYSGIYAMKCSDPSASKATKTIGSQSETYTGAEFYFDHNFAGSETLITYFNVNGNPTVSMGLSVQSGSVFAFVQTTLSSYSYGQYRLTGITPGTWNKLAVDASATSATIYLNDQQLTAISQNNIPATASVSVGMFWGSCTYTGNLYIDNIQIATSYGGNSSPTPTPTPTKSPIPTPTSTPTPTPTPTPTGTSVFSSGFEDGFNSWTSTHGGVSIVSSPVYSGSYAMKCSDPWGSQATKSIAMQSETYTVAEFSFDKNFAGTQTLIAYFNGNSNPSVTMGISVQSGKVFVVVEDKLPTYSYRQYPLTGVTPGTWYKFALDASATSASIYVNDQKLTSISQTNIPATVTVSVGMFWGDGSYTGNLYIDNIQIGT